MDALVKRKIVRADPWLPRGFVRFFAVVVGVQAVHVFEHIVQLIQVFVLHVPDDDALGLLGLVFQFQGTEEWLHLVFNATYVTAFFLLLRPLWRAPRSVVPRWALWAFLVAGVGLQSWHAVEHVVIISGVIANSGCPCPGILDAALGTTDTVLHFFYNTVTFLGLLAPFWYLARRHLVLARSPQLPADGLIAGRAAPTADGRPIHVRRRRVDAGSRRIEVVAGHQPTAGDEQAWEYQVAGAGAGFHDQEEPVSPYLSHDAEGHLPLGS